MQNRLMTVIFFAAHVDYLADKAKLLFACKLPNDLLKKQTFFAPRLYKLNHIAILKEDGFRPCVHVIRFKQTGVSSPLPE